MDISQQLLKKYIPMTESTYYVLLALKEPRHGYAIMQFISELTSSRIHMGTGTLYTMLGRLVEDELIKVVDTGNGKKTYIITDIGTNLIKEEITRLSQQLKNGEDLYGEC